MSKCPKTRKYILNNIITILGGEMLREIDAVEAENEKQAELIMIFETGKKYSDLEAENKRLLEIVADGKAIVELVDANYPNSSKWRTDFIAKANQALKESENMITFNLRAPNGNYYRGHEPSNSRANCWCGDSFGALTFTLEQARLIVIGFHNDLSIVIALESEPISDELFRKEMYCLAGGSWHYYEESRK